MKFKMIALCSVLAVAGSIFAQDANQVPDSVALKISQLENAKSDVQTEMVALKDRYTIDQSQLDSFTGEIAALKLDALKAAKKEPAEWDVQRVGASPADWKYMFVAKPKAAPPAPEKK